MARLNTSGFELNTLAQDVEWRISTGSPTIVTSPVRSGTYAYRINNASAAQNTYTLFRSSNTADGHYFRVYVYIAAAPTALSKIIAVGSTTPIDDVSIRINANLTLELWNDEDNVQVGSDSSALSLSTWYRLELKVDSTTISSTAIAGLIDGASFASGTIALDNGSAALRLGHVAADATLDAYFDDVAINDDSGSFQNSYPGVGEVIHLRPNNTGDNSTWVGDYTAIDEVTPDDGTTMITSKTSGEIEDVNIDDTPAALASDDTINCVQVGFRGTLQSGVDPDPNAVLRIEASSGGTVEESANTDIPDTNWYTNKPSTLKNYHLTLYDLPGASTTGWTKTDLDAAQIGVRMTASDAFNFNISTLWLLVDHKPAEAVAGTTVTSTITMMGV